MERSGYVATELLEQGLSSVPDDPRPEREMHVRAASPSFSEAVGLPFLEQAQNADGGWGYARCSPSSVEPTCWALLALTSQARDWAGEIGKAGEWLGRAQLPDGGWGNCSGQKEGTWCTALAGLALQASGMAPEAVARGARWVSDTWPREGGLLWRARTWRAKKRIRIAQDYSLRGWSWTAGTASWVEPTSYALLFLGALPDGLQTQAMTRRRRMGEAMLLNRVCPGGGWNSGNPVVYGVPGEPAVGTTVWALLALRDQADRREVSDSLRWLENAYQHLEGPASIAQAHWCLRLYGRPVVPLDPVLRSGYDRNQFFGNVLTTSWAILAQAPEPNWLHHRPGSWDKI